MLASAAHHQAVDTCSSCPRFTSAPPTVADSPSNPFLRAGLQSCSEEYPFCSRHEGGENCNLDAGYWLWSTLLQCLFRNARDLFPPSGVLSHVPRLYNLRLCCFWQVLGQLKYTQFEPTSLPRGASALRRGTVARFHSAHVLPLVYAFSLGDHRILLHYPILVLPSCTIATGSLMRTCRVCL